jgi:hypothetical protein
MKSKTEKWKKDGVISIPIPEDKDVFICEIDSLRRPSAIRDAKPGQKCIVILKDDENETRKR